MTPDDPANGWVEYRRLVLSELSRLSDAVEHNGRQIDSLKIEVVRLKVKSGMWGGFSGLAAALGALFLKVLLGK